MTLAELQTKFQNGILENDRSVLASIADFAENGSSDPFCSLLRCVPDASRRIPVE